MAFRATFEALFGYNFSKNDKFDSLNRSVTVRRLMAARLRKKTSVTAGTLCEMAAKIVRKYLRKKM
jgi:hypothetical protein